jgi:glucosylceramidase
MSADKQEVQSLVVSMVTNLISIIATQEILRAYFGPPSSSLGYSLCRTHIGSIDFALGSYSSDNTADDFELHDFQTTRDQQYLIPLVKR